MEMTPRDYQAVFERRIKNIDFLNNCLGINDWRDAAAMDKMSRIKELELEVEELLIWINKFKERTIKGE